MDGLLQVFHLGSGEMVTRFSKSDSDRLETLVRLTFDGLYCVWVDESSIKVGQVADGTIIGHTSTHEKPTSLEMMDFGYVLIVGREDGHMLTMKLMTQTDEKRGSSSTYKAKDASDRRNLILDQDTCTRDITSKFDKLYQKYPQVVSDDDIPEVGEEVVEWLTQHANVPRSVISTKSSAIDIQESSEYRISYSDQKPNRSSNYNQLSSSPIGTPVYEARWNSHPWSRGGSPCASPVAIHVGNRKQHSSTASLASNNSSEGDNNYHSKMLKKRSRSAQELNRLDRTLSKGSIDSLPSNTSPAMHGTAVRASKSLLRESLPIFQKQRKQKESSNRFLALFGFKNKKSSEKK